MCVYTYIHDMNIDSCWQDVGRQIGEEEDDKRPLLVHNNKMSSSSCSSSAQLLKTPLKSTGNIWTALAHIITGVIGSGVLSLAWSMAQLGWIAGPLCMLLFASFTLVSALLLCNCYRFPDPESGDTRNPSYLEAVQTILVPTKKVVITVPAAPGISGKKSAWICGILVRINLFKVGVVYTITSAISMRAIQRSNCYHKEGHNAACESGSFLYMLLFGIVQIVVSQIPDFSNTKLLSIVAAIMSFTYSIIGSALGLAKVIGDGQIKGGIGGVPTSTTTQKVWLVSQALGDIAFAFPFSIILLEIQDTLKSTPPEKVTMKKASTIAVCITTFFYLCCGGFGYAAFGNSTPGNLLTGFGFYEPYWLIDFTNACVVLHLVGGYQVFSQPQFAIAERWFAKKFPDSGFINNNYGLKLPSLATCSLNPLRLCFRTAYVASVTGIAMTFPYFNQVVAVAGALMFWPLVIYFPVEMYTAQKKISAWTSKWVVLRLYSFVCLLVAMFALIGSIEGLMTARFG